MHLTTMSALQGAREDFPGLQLGPYLDVAARGLLSTSVRAEIDRYLDMRMYKGADKEAMFGRIETTRQRFADLVGASADEIAFTKNVSDGINSFAAALPWRPGDNVVLCQDLEHPANIFPWHNLRRKVGIDLKLVPADRGRLPLDRILAAIDGRTRVVTVSSVSFSPGFRFPVEELGRHTRPLGVLLLVDGAQSVGILATDVAKMGVDALAVSTQKGLLGLYGMGFLYVRRAVADTLVPTYLSRFGVDLGPERHEAAAGDAGAYRFAVGARRFDVGNYNYLAAAAVDRAMEQMQALGYAAIEQYVCGLADTLTRELARLGVPVFEAPDAQRAHIVAVGCEMAALHDSTDDADILDLHARLESAGIRHTIRRGVIRLSLHYYNNEDDIDRVCAVARQWLAERGTAARLGAAHPSSA